MQRDPSINYAVFSFGDLTIGLNAALTSAGLAGKLKIAGETATAANLAAVKAGTELAWTAANTAPLPTQVVTKENVNEVLLDSAGYYVGVQDYESQFKKLWLVD